MSPRSPRHDCKFPTRREVILSQARIHGMQVESNRPGNGSRRYQFTTKLGMAVICNGAAEAEMFLRGYAAAYCDLVKERKQSPPGETPCSKR